MPWSGCVDEQGAVTGCISGYCPTVLGLAYVEANGLGEFGPADILFDDELFSVSAFVVFHGDEPVVVDVIVETPELCVGLVVDIACFTSWVEDATYVDTDTGVVNIVVYLHSELIPGAPQAVVFMGFTAHGEECFAEQPQIFWSTPALADASTQSGGAVCGALHL
jgi:hypothetical protein